MERAIARAAKQPACGLRPAPQSQSASPYRDHPYKINFAGDCDRCVRSCAGSNHDPKCRRPQSGTFNSPYFHDDPGICGLDCATDGESTPSSPMRFRWGRPELERLPLQDGLYQRADKLVEINGRLLIIKAHERKDSPAQTMSSQTKNRRHLASRRSSWRPILRPASAHTESPSTRGWSDNWL